MGDDSPMSGRGQTVMLVDADGTAQDQMDRDREILSRISLWRRPILRFFRIRSGVTVGRSWSGALPSTWPMLSEGPVVRPTGGGAVLHGTDFCLSLFVPWSREFPRGQGWSRFYERLHRWIGDGLGESGILSSEVAICQDPSVRRGNLQPSGLCFAEPVRGDREVNGRKIVGGALGLFREGLLYQGSICPPDPSPPLSRLFEGWYCLQGRESLEAVLFSERDEDAWIEPCGTS
ncbi:MAG: lipoyl protein ligase domain-containing protein [Leptospirillia bacterium]